MHWQRCCRFGSVCEQDIFQRVFFRTGYWNMLQDVVNPGVVNGRCPECNFKGAFNVLAPDKEQLCSCFHMFKQNRVRVDEFHVANLFSPKAGNNLPDLWNRRKLSSFGIDCVNRTKLKSKTRTNTSEVTFSYYLPLSLTISKILYYYHTTIFNVCPYFPYHADIVNYPCRYPSRK